MWARTGNILLGSWLVISAFVWPHTRAEFASATIVGGLCFAVALVATVHPPSRHWNLVLGAWLVVSSLILPHELVTALHDVAVGAAMFALALVRTPGWMPRVTLEDRLREISAAIARDQRA